MKISNTVFIDDVDIRTLGLHLLADHDNPIISGTRDYGVAIPGMNGALDYGSDLEPIQFNIPLYIPAANPMELQTMVRKVKSILLDAYGKPRTFKLTFGYETDKYYNVRVSGNVPIDRIFARSGRFVLPLICHEGHALSVARNDEVTWGNTVIPFSSEYTLGHTGDGSKSFTVEGSTIVTLTGNNIRPILHITGSGTDVEIEWGGKSMNLGTFTDATWVFDLGEYVVLKNGALALHLITGDWITMEFTKGDNLINVNGSGLDLTFRVEFRDRYF